MKKAEYRRQETGDRRQKTGDRIERRPLADDLIKGLALKANPRNLSAF